MGKNLTQGLPAENNIDLDPRLFNGVYYPLLFKVPRYLVLYGGSGSGKSYFMGQMYAVQLTVFPGRNLVCLRKQKTDCLKSCFSFIYNALSRLQLLRYWDVRKNPEYIMRNKLNGNTILFEGVDYIEDIKSIQFTREGVDLGPEYANKPGFGENLTDVWYEEVDAEGDPEVIRELDRRLRDPYVKCRLGLSFNPVARTHWLFNYVTQELTLPGVDSIVLKTTHKDNPHLPQEYRDVLERYRTTDPYAYMVYCLGEWGVMGQTVFDANKISKRLFELEQKYSKNPYSIGYFTFARNNKGLLDEDKLDESLEFVLSTEGDIKIYSDRKPRYPYVVAVDTAGDGSDYYAAQVCDNTTGEQVAVFHSNGSVDYCVEQVYCLCCYYNYALYCPEANFDSYPIKYFAQRNYPNIYRRMGSSDSVAVSPVDRFGFRTGKDNRQTMLSEMVEYTRDNMHLINDIDTLSEMLTFTVQQKKMKGIWWGAENGAFDDLVMSYAILLQARGQQTFELQSEVRKLSGYWTREELEDAVAEGRITYYAMQKYLEEHGAYMEEYQFPYMRRKGSRYAR